MVCYFHPPAATGVRRLVSLLRHLPDRGWRPLVLACRDAAGSGRDEGPLSDARVARTPVVRTGSLDPYRLAAIANGPSAASSSAADAADGRSLRKTLMQLLRRHVFLPDDRMGWIPFAAVAGIRLARRHRVRAIYSSNYPQSTHVVALIVSAATGLPWLADFRDGWTQNPAFHDPGNPLLRAGQRLLERLVARRADAIVSVSPPIARHLQSLRPARMRPAETVFNGFEPEEFPDAPGATTTPLEPGRITLLYAGTFFGRRTPMPFLKALHALLRARPDLRDRLRVRLRTTLEPRWLRAIERARLGDVVQVMPPIPFADCLAEQRRADACLLVLEDGPGADIMVSQKVFEYLAARRPVFAMVPEGAAAEVLRSTGGAEISVRESPPAAARRLGAFFDRVAANDFPPASDAALAAFRRDRQAARIAAILDEISS